MHLLCILGGGMSFASPVSKAQRTYSVRLVAHCLYKPNVPVVPAFAPTLCNRSPTFLFASKNLATHRSMQTLSPLLSSPSVYRVLTHFAWHVLKWGVSGTNQGPGQNTCETRRLKISVNMSNLNSLVRGSTCQRNKDALLYGHFHSFWVDRA